MYTNVRLLYFFYLFNFFYSMIHEFYLCLNAICCLISLLFSGSEYRIQKSPIHLKENCCKVDAELLKLKSKFPSFRINVNPLPNGFGCKYWSEDAAMTELYESDDRVM